MHGTPDQSARRRLPDRRILCFGPRQVVFRRIVALVRILKSENPFCRMRLRPSRFTAAQVAVDRESPGARRNTYSLLIGNSTPEIPELPNDSDLSRHEGLMAIDSP